MIDQTTADKTLAGNKLAGGNPERGRVANDYYATHSDSTKALLKVESIVYPALEPACGEGHISKLLAGDVTSIDLIDRGFGTGGIDFLTWQPDRQYQDVITNPPFSLFLQFLDKSLQVASHRVYLFGKLVALEGQKRATFLEGSPLKYVYVFKARQQPLSNGNPIDPKTGKKWASSTMAFAWFVWEKEYEGKPTIKWLDKDEK